MCSQRKNEGSQTWSEPVGWWWGGGGVVVVKVCVCVWGRGEGGGKERGEAGLCGCVWVVCCCVLCCCCVVVVLLLCVVVCCCVLLCVVVCVVCVVVCCVLCFVRSLVVVFVCGEEEGRGEEEGGRTVVWLCVGCAWVVWVVCGCVWVLCGCGLWWSVVVVLVVALVVASETVQASIQT